VISPFFLVQTRGFEMAAAESRDRQKKSQKSALCRDFHIVNICCDFFPVNILGVAYRCRSPRYAAKKSQKPELRVNMPSFIHLLYTVSCTLTFEKGGILTLKVTVMLTFEIFFLLFCQRLCTRCSLRC
jgi:hypothetical protein